MGAELRCRQSPAACIARCIRSRPPDDARVSTEKSVSPRARPLRYALTMATQSQYRLISRLVVACVVMAGITLFLCAGGIGALVMWVAPDIGSRPQQAFIDRTTALHTRA